MTVTGRSRYAKMTEKTLGPWHVAIVAIITIICKMDVRKDERWSVQVGKERRA